MSDTDFKIIEAYNKGESMNSIAKRLGIYAVTVKRILERNHVELRHDALTKGSFVVRDGEKLIEWAKAQGRLVTKAELAQLIGRKRLSPSYFMKYPELGKYVVSREQKDVREYTQKLYEWLKENNIPYKPSDKKKLKVTVDALLLGEYTGLAIQVAEKAVCVSNKRHEERMNLKVQRAKEANIDLILLKKEHFENLDSIKELLNSLKS